jgi:OOP family OmpA-OmpF porin
MKSTRNTSLSAGGLPLDWESAAGGFKTDALAELHQIIVENNMKRISKTAGVLGLVGYAVMGSSLALAEDDSFWYGGLNIGQSRASIDDARITSQLLTSGLTTNSIVDDDRDTAYKIFGGYQMNKNFALEAGYFNLGKFGYTATTTPLGTLDGTIKLQGLNLDLVGLWPFTEKFAAFGRLGANYAQTQDSFAATGAVGVPTNANPSEKATNYKAGFGLQYDFSRSLAMRAEAERYRINDGVGNKGDISLISLGLVYRFGQSEPAPVRQVAATPVAPAPVAVIVPVLVKTQRYCSILDIQFEIKQDVIQLEDKEKLAVVGTFMKKYPDTTAVIEGHSDNVGISPFNMKLSQQRADSVVSYLVNDLKIAPSRLSAVGYGETRPIADNSTNEGRQANRRISAVIACATDIAGLKVTPARMTVAMEMEFDPYKHEIQQQYVAGLGEVAKFMNANPSIKATVEGHAGGRVGKANVSTSEATEIAQLRAQAVVNHLVAAGVSRSRLTAEGFGKTRRVSYGITAEGQQENRRVNIVFNYSK